MALCRSWRLWVGWRHELQRPVCLTLFIAAVKGFLFRHNLNAWLPWTELTDHLYLPEQTLHTFCRKCRHQGLVFSGILHKFYRLLLNSSSQKWYVHILIMDSPVVNTELNQSNQCLQLGKTALSSDNSERCMCSKGQKHRFFRVRTTNSASQQVHFSLVCTPVYIPYAHELVSYRYLSLIRPSDSVIHTPDEIFTIL